MNTCQLTKESAMQLLSAQKDFFKQGNTLSFKYRMEKLQQLYDAIIKYKDRIEYALKTDLGKCQFESYMSEIGIILSSITHAKKHLKEWMKPEKANTPIYIFPAKSYIESVPYGSVLIMGPYNYPFQLLIEPLIGAIASGNCIILSPSELTPTVSNVIKEVITNTFNPNYICCVDGGIENNTILLHSRFDYIFFTGSVNVGKIVMKAASENLIPVTLELGGKSPVIVDHTARLETACERIIWGKLMNAGQTCVAPDYILVNHNIYEAFINELIFTIQSFYGKDIKQSPDFGRIVNHKHMDRLKNILKSDKNFIRFGGKYDDNEKYIEPTIICPDSLDAACMQEELFGPILPVIAYKNLSDALDIINKQETPLALYIFSQENSFIEKILKSTSSGGVCINDTISHLINPNLPFGGKGHSGMGSYHGKNSFLTFSHKRSILNKSTRINIRLAYPPFTENKLKKIIKYLK